MRTRWGEARRSPWDRARTPGPCGERELQHMGLAWICPFLSFSPSLLTSAREAHCARAVMGFSLCRIRWNRIFSMSLLVEHVLLGVNAHLPELRDLVQRHILMLGKVRSGRAGSEGALSSPFLSFCI